jgi:hypothetical protein
MASPGYWRDCAADSLLRSVLLLAGLRSVLLLAGLRVPVEGAAESLADPQVAPWPCAGLLQQRRVFPYAAILARLSFLVNRQQRARVTWLDQADWAPAADTEILPPRDPLSRADNGPS